MSRLMNTTKIVLLNINRLSKYFFAYKYSVNAQSSFEIKNRAFIHCHDILMSQPSYSKTIVQKFDMKKKGIDDYNIHGSQAKTFITVYYNYINDGELLSKKNKMLSCINYLKINSYKMTTHDIQNILLCFLQNEFHPGFLPLYNEFDMACCKQIHNLNINDILYLTDIWYCLRMKYCKFSIAALKILSKDLFSLSVNQYVQYMFLLAIMRPHVHGCSINIKNDIEEKFMSVIKYCTINEVGIICLGMHINRHFITKDEIIRNLFSMLENSISEVSNINLGNISKVLKKGLKPYINEHYKLCSNLYSLLAEKCEFTDIYPYIHILSIGNDIEYIDERILNSAIITIMKVPLKFVRCKDVDRLLNIIMNYDYTQSNATLIPFLCNVLRYHIKRKDIPFKELYNSVYHLAALQYFPMDIITEVFRIHLSEDFGATTDTLLIQVFWLNEMLKLEGIELPSKVQLSPKETSIYNQHNTESRKLIPNSKRANFTAEVESLFNKIFGDKNIYDLLYILTMDPTKTFVFCTNKDGLPVAIPIEYKIASPDCNKYQTDYYHLNFHAILPASFNCTIYNTQELKGCYKMFNRYKEKCGYKTGYVVQKLMKNMTEEEKVKYICNVIQPFVNKTWLQKRLSVLCGK